MGNITKLLTCAALAVLLVGCGNGQAPSLAAKALVIDLASLQFDETVTAEMKPWLQQAWPKVLASCPGFSRFGSDIGPAGGKGYYSDYAFGDKKAVVVVFKVNDAPKDKSLVTYRALGHTCYYAIAHPGAESIEIPKDPCKSVCLDRDVRDSTDDFVPLR